jgi:anionic cell wall polymer biosynthesis LytR-Cps2A-Psr (LCP) family protein
MAARSGLAQIIQRQAALLRRRLAMRRVSQQRKVGVLKSTTNKVSSTKKSGVSISSKLKLAVIGVVALFVIAGLISRVTPISLQPYAKAAGLTPDPLVGNRMNIMVFIYENEQGFDFLDALMVLSLQAEDGRVNLFMLNPDFSTRVLSSSYVPVRNLLSNAEVQRKIPLQELRKLAQDTLGMPIDRYIAIPKQNVDSLFSAVGIHSITAVDNIQDPEAGLFTIGQSVSGSQINKYLGADAGGNNRKMSRGSKVLKQLLDEQFSWPNLVSGVWNAKHISKLMYTDLSANEVLNLANFINTSQGVKVDFVSINDAYLIDTTTGAVLVPNLLQIDDKVRAVMARQKVVREQARIEIYNATGENGVATRYKRQIYNYGGNVIRAGNYAEHLERSVLYVPQPTNYPHTVNLVREITRNNIEIREEAYPYNHTGELVLVIGGNGL